MAYHPTEDTPGERFLLISLESRPAYGGDHRHLKAAVVRRAMPHVMKEYSEGVDKYYDDYAAKCSGYRWADYSSTKSTGIEVRNLFVHAQMDVYGPSKNCEGQPYINDVRASCHSRVEAREVKKLHDAFLALERRNNKLHAQGHVFADTYADACRRFMLALGIKKFLVARPGREGADLSDTAAFVVYDEYQHLDAAVAYLVDRAHGRA